MVTKRFGALIGSGLAVVLAIGGVIAHGGNSPQLRVDFNSKPVASPSNRQTVNFGVSWAELYQSVPDLKTHSDLVVSGHFSKILGHTIDDTGIPFTDFAFVVDSVLFDLKSKERGVGDVLRVHQTGGVINNVTQQIGDDPLFKVDEKAVLFLREYQPCFFMVAGGPTGRFHKSESGDISPSSNEGIKFSGSFAAFTALVKNS